MLATLANQTAVAIANARLYRQASLHLLNLQRANEELVQLDQMKDEFVQTVSHELRTPITFIRGYVELLVEGALGALDTEQDEALHTVLKATDGVIALVNDVITLTRGADLGASNEKVDIGSVASMSCAGRRRGRRVRRPEDGDGSCPTTSRLCRVTSAGWGRCSIT